MIRTLVSDFSLFSGEEKVANREYCIMGGGRDFLP